MSTITPRKMVMANSANLVSLAREAIEQHRVGKLVPIHVLKSIIASPRLFDIYVQDFKDDEAVLAGDSFLDLHTMLADDYQKTFAISLSRWQDVRELYTEVNSFHYRDARISKLQIWPFEPSVLSHAQMSLAVAVSINDLELLEEPRLCGALRDLLYDFGVEFFWEPRAYDC